MYPQITVTSWRVTARFAEDRPGRVHISMVPNAVEFCVFAGKHGRYEVTAKPVELTDSGMTMGSHPGIRWRFQQGSRLNKQYQATLAAEVARQLQAQSGEYWDAYLKLKEADGHLTDAELESFASS